MSAPSIPDSIRSLREEWVAEDGYSPRAINRGECLTFANEVVAECPNAFMKRTGDEDVLGPPENPQYDMEPFHVWVSDGTRHYDVEVPEGVENWWELPFFKRTGFDKNTMAVDDE